MAGEEVLIIFINVVEGTMVIPYRIRGWGGGSRDFASLSCVLSLHNSRQLDLPPWKTLLSRLLSMDSSLQGCLE
jgi:hypothetical protein